MPREPIRLDQIDGAILILRGHRVLLDSDLAALYGVEVKVLNQAVGRNGERFPADFMFRLTRDEARRLRSQIVTLDGEPAESNGNLVPIRSPRGQHIKHLPYAFTEQGVAMLSSVLRSPRAVQVNIEIMRAFVRLRQLLLSNAELAAKLAALEKKYDAEFRVVFDAIRELMTPPKVPRNPIGFGSDPGSARR
jgi:hypothetical protein